MCMTPILLHAVVKVLIEGSLPTTCAGRVKAIGNPSTPLSKDSSSDLTRSHPSVTSRSQTTTKRHAAASCHSGLARPSTFRTR